MMSAAAVAASESAVESVPAEDNAAAMALSVSDKAVSWLADTEAPATCCMSCPACFSLLAAAFISVTAVEILAEASESEVAVERAAKAADKLEAAVERLEVAADRLVAEAASVGSEARSEAACVRLVAADERSGAERPRPADSAKREAELGAAIVGAVMDNETALANDNTPPAGMGRFEGPKFPTPKPGGTR